MNFPLGNPAVVRRKLLAARSVLDGQKPFHGFDIGFGDALRGVVIPHLRGAGTLGLQVSQSHFTALELAGSGRGDPFGGGFARFLFVAHDDFLRPFSESNPTGATENYTKSEVLRRLWRDL